MSDLHIGTFYDLRYQSCHTATIANRVRVMEAVQAYEAKTTALSFLNRGQPLVLTNINLPSKAIFLGASPSGRCVSDDEF